MAATVKKTRGDSPAFLETNLNAWFKFQNVSGTWGYTTWMFIALSPCNEGGARKERILTEHSFVRLPLSHRTKALSATNLCAS